MRSKGLIVAILILGIFVLIFCLVYPKSIEQSIYEIPEQNVKYNGFEFGNVVDEGKQAVILKFESDYNVVKMEIAGVVLDTNGQTLHTFDTEIGFDQTPTKNPRQALRIDKELIYRVGTVSFTKILAYTNEEIPSD